MSIKSDAIKELLTEYPDESSHMISRIALERHPKLFDSKNQARSMVNYYRGRMGRKHREKLADRRFVIPEPTKVNPFSLPPSDEHEITPYQINCKRTLVLPDIHVPYHSISALNVALEYGKDRNVDCILLLGDFMDCHTCSRYEKDPEARDMDYELSMARHFLMSLRQNFPKAKIVLMEGNHDMRLQSYIRRNASAIAMLDEFRLEILLRCHEYGVKWIGDKRSVIHGEHLYGFHGHEFFGGAGVVNPARSLFVKAKACAYQGHNHRTSAHSEKTVGNKVLSTWSIGCLSELQPQYMPYNNWNHGFAEVELDKNGFKFHNFRIINGVAYYG